MRCKNCREVISPGSSLCPNCGVPIKSLPKKFKTTNLDKRKNKIKSKKEKPSTRAKLGAEPVLYRNEVSAAGSKIDSLFLSKKRKKIRRARIIGSLFVALGFFILGSLIFLTIKTLIKPYNSAYLVPEDANIYVSIKIQEEHPQIKTFKKISKKFTYSKGIDQYIQDIIKEFIKEDELNFQQDIKPWVGDELVLIWLQDKDKPKVMFLGSKNKNETQNSLNKLFQSSKEKKDKNIYQQTEIITINGISYAQIDNYLVVSYSQENIKKIIETKKNKNKSLAKNSAFYKVKSNLSEENLLFAYFNLKEILKQTESGKIYNLDTFFNQQQLKTIEGYGAIVTACDNGIKLKGYLYADENKIKKLEENFKSESFKPNLVNSLPVSSIFYAEKFNLKKSIQKFQENLTKSNSILKDYIIDFKSSLKNQYGIDIDEDIFSWMDLNCALILTPHIEKENSQLIFDTSLIFDLKNKNKVFEKIEKIKNAIENKENTSSKNVQISEHILGNKIELQFKETETEGEKIYSLPLPEYPGITFNYAFIEDKLIFSTSHQAISSTLQLIKKSDKNLASDSTYTKTISEFPQENNGLFYINTQNLIDIINFDCIQINNIYLSYFKRGEEQDSTEQSKVGSYIKSIKAIGFTSESSENEITTYGFLLIE